MTWVARGVTGDTPEEKIAELRPLIRLLARERVGGSPWLLEDAEQEALIAAWTRLCEGKSTGIAVHKAKQAIIDVARGARMTGSNIGTSGKTDTHGRSISIFKDDDEEGSYVLEPADDGALEAYDVLVLREALSGALAVLPPRDREMVEAVFFEDLTRRQVAERYGVTHQAVSLAVKRSMAALRPLLEAS